MFPSVSPKDDPAPPKGHLAAPSVRSRFKKKRPGHKKESGSVRPLYLLLYSPFKNSQGAIPPRPCFLASAGRWRALRSARSFFDSFPFWGAKNINDGEFWVFTDKWILGYVGHFFVGSHQGEIESFVKDYQVQRNISHLAVEDFKKYCSFALAWKSPT